MELNEEEFKKFKKNVLDNLMRRDKDFYEALNEIRKKLGLNWKEFLMWLISNIKWDKIEEEIKIIFEKEKIKEKLEREKEEIAKWRIEMQNLRKAKEEILFKQNVLNSLENLYRMTKSFKSLKEFIEKGFIYRKEEAQKILEEFIRKKRESIMINETKRDFFNDEIANRFISFNRLFIVGQIGKGKTELLKFLIQNIKKKPVIIFDTLRNYNFGTIIRAEEPDYTILKEKLKEKFKEKKVISIQLINEEDYFEILRWLYNERNFFKDYHLVIDEAYLFIEQRRQNYKASFSVELFKLSRLGRNWGVKIIASSQRLTTIDKDFLSTFSNYVLFDVGNKREIDYFSEYYIHLDEYTKEIILSQDIGEFCYIHWKEKKRMKYDLQNKKIIDLDKVEEWKNVLKPQQIRKKENNEYFDLEAYNREIEKRKEQNPNVEIEKIEL